MSGRRGTPNDPERRERILEAALQVIAEQGVHRTTHRRIATQAQVPLGSLTYYFQDLPQILARAFERFIERYAGRYDRALAGARSLEEACTALVELICGDDLTSPQEQRVIVELYSYASFSPEVAALRAAWIQRSQAALLPHTDSATAQALDALLEGWTLHRGFQDSQIDRSAVEQAVRRIAGLPAAAPAGSPAAD